MAPKKGQKMALGDFLADESLGARSSWADEMEDIPTIPAGDRQSSGYGARREFGSPPSASGNDRYSGYSRADRDFPTRDQLPIPDKPPYTAHIGNLSFDATEGEISDFFGSCEVTNVRLVRDRETDRPKGFGYVEFGSKEGLIKALDLNSSQLAGRNVRISVAEPPKDRSDERMTHEWRRTGPLPPLPSEQPRRVYEEGGREGGRRQSSFEGGDGRVRDFGNWERKGPLSPLSPTSEHGGRPRGDREFRRRSPAPSADGDRPGGFRERPAAPREPSAAEKDNEWRRGARPDASQRSQPASPILPHTRPKLELKKRSEQPVETTPASSSDKPNPFGGARPIDTTQREKEIEERRAATVAARKAEEEKVRDEKKAARAVDASDKGSDAGTPTAGKNFDVLRRVSAAGSDQGMAADVPGAVEEVIEEPQEKLQEKPQEKKKVEKVGKPQTKGPDDWRARGQVKSTSTAAPTETDGWSTVGPKRGSRSGSKSVPAS